MKPIPDSVKVGERENKCIDKAVKSLMVGVEDMVENKEVLDIKDLDALVWLFEAVMWRTKKTFTRTVVQALVAHIILTDKKLDSRKGSK